MYGLLNYVKKLDKIAVQFINTLQIITYEKIEDIKEGTEIREKYNENISKVRNNFVSYYTPVLERLSQDEQNLNKKRKILFYLNTFLVGTFTFLAFKQTIPLRIIILLSSLTGMTINVILNYKLTELIYTKDDYLKSYELMLFTMNQADELIDEYIKEMEDEPIKVVNIPKNNNHNNNDYTYSSNIGYKNEQIVEENTKIKRRRITRDRRNRDGDQ